MLIIISGCICVPDKYYVPDTTNVTLTTTIVSIESTTTTTTSSSSTTVADGNVSILAQPSNSSLNLSATDIEIVLTYDELKNLNIDLRKEIDKLNFTLSVSRSAFVESLKECYSMNNTVLINNNNLSESSNSFLMNLKPSNCHNV